MCNRTTHLNAKILIITISFKIDRSHADKMKVPKKPFGVVVGQIKKIY